MRLVLNLFILFLFVSGTIFPLQPIEFCATHHHAHQIQPITRKACFFNNDQERKHMHLRDSLKIFWKTITGRSFYYPDDHGNWMAPDAVIARSVSLHAQWIGHASFLIQVNDFNILTDPVFFDLNKILYRRKTPVGISPDKLPAIDFVVISHNHRDHLDECSINLLKAEQPIMLVPQGTKRWFAKRGFKHVYEHAWWQKTTFMRNDKKIEFTFTPAVHWSGRHPFDIHRSLWGGWLINAHKQTLYFAGDTGFSKEIFKAIGQHAHIDCALLPIGPCEPRHHMCNSHMGPEDVIPACELLNAVCFIPMHWGTFRLGPDAFDVPIKLVCALWQEQEEPIATQLRLIKFGQRIQI